MKNRGIYLYMFWVLLVTLFLAGAASAQEQNSAIPGPGWQVMRAEWGSASRWMDVTYRVRVLLSGKGMVKVNNVNMGGDPAVGVDKVLRIHARNFQGQSRQFSCKEGSNIDASQFYNYGGGIGEGNGTGWQVMWAEWGSGNRQMDVTNRVRSLLSGNGMVKVNNANMGGDPAIGANKVLRISARDMQGQVQQFSYKEGSNIDASQFYNYGGGIGGGNGTGWQVMQAQWGSGNQQMDVTNRVRLLLSGNGMVKVNNANMGGDPAIGADKVLRISARDMRGQVQQLSYKEGSSIDASQFYNYGGGYPGNPGNPGGGYGELQIVRAFYGLNNQNNDVTQLLRGMVRNGSLIVQVNNNNMGDDPAQGADKVLTVIYRYQGREQTSTVKEGGTLRIP
jgi:hypothetical protein